MTAPMIPVCLHFRVHQPYRLRRYNYFDVGREHRYFDDSQNRELLRRAVEKCYLPAVAMLQRLLDRRTQFAVSLSVSGCLLEQLQEDAPEARDAFRRLGDSGRVEFLAETSHHSLAWLASREEFATQVDLHGRRIGEEFGRETRVFRNTELIYCDALAAFLERKGYAGALADGVQGLLGGRSPHHVYRAATPGGLPLLLRDHLLSDSIPLRFSDRSGSARPPTVEKDERRAPLPRGDVVSLFMDFETFGARPGSETGVFEAFESWVERHLAGGGAFLTPSEAIAKLPRRDALAAPGTVSRADESRDLSAWQGNDLQRDALKRLFALESRVKAAGSEELLRDFRRLSASDHFSFMATRAVGDGKVRADVSPFGSPYEAYITFMHVVSDLERRLPRSVRARASLAPFARPAPPA